MFKVFKKSAKRAAHTHDWKLVACNDEYYTTYTNTGEKTYWNQRFYECGCGERKHTDNHKDISSHAGIDKVKKNWVDAGVVPKNSYFPDETKGYVKPPSYAEELDPVLEYQKTLDELVKSLGVVLNRDFNMEDRYPKLKKAAQDYHLLLDKYRVYEKLKGTDDEQVH